jgi:hypothetical protein
MKLSRFKQIPSLVFFENVPRNSGCLWLLHSKRSMLSLVSSCVVSQMDTLRPTGRSCAVMLRFTGKRNLISVSVAEGGDECVIPVRHKTYLSAKFLRHGDLLPTCIPALLQHEIGFLVSFLSYLKRAEATWKVYSSRMFQTKGTNMCRII